MPRLMRPPRSPSLPSATGLGEVGGIRTRITGLRARDPEPLDDNLDLVDSEGIEPSSPGCRPGIHRAAEVNAAARFKGDRFAIARPLNDEPILARTTGLEPVLPR
jgi:hypothetical protein